MFDDRDDFGALLRQHINSKGPDSAENEKVELNPQRATQKKSTLRKAFKRQKKKTAQALPEAATTGAIKRPLSVDKDSESDSESEPDSDSNAETSTPWSRRGATTVVAVEEQPEPMIKTEENRKRPEFTLIVCKRKKKKRVKAEPTPFKPNRICKYFLQGKCNNNPCTYIHASNQPNEIVPNNRPNELVPMSIDVPLERKVCKFFKNGSCKHGTRCRSSHDLKQELCTYFEAGLCNKGEGCPYSHDLMLKGYGSTETAIRATGAR